MCRLPGRSGTICSPRRNASRRAVCVSQTSSMTWVCNLAAAASSPLASATEMALSSALARVSWRSSGVWRSSPSPPPSSPAAPVCRRVRSASRWSVPACPRLRNANTPATKTAARISQLHRTGTLLYPQHLGFDAPDPTSRCGRDNGALPMGRSSAERIEGGPAGHPEPEFQVVSPVANSAVPTPPQRMPWGRGGPSSTTRGNPRVRF